jgi:hypothetical protein
VTLLVLNATGTLSAAGGPFAAPDSSAPPLAKLCPPPADAPQAQPAPPTAGARISDEEAGISYARLTAPWRNWDRGVWAEGSLGVAFKVGEYFVTESYAGGDYLAGIQSGSVPATVNDGTVLDLKCTGQQVADDVRRSYYPQPNEKQPVRDEFTFLGGRPAWVSVFRLSFTELGLQARDELVAVALIDVGRTTAAVLYISIPGTHRQYDAVVDQVFDSVRPLG